MAEDAVEIPLPSYPNTNSPINPKKNQTKNKAKNLQHANQTKIHITDKN